MGSKCEHFGSFATPQDVLFVVFVRDCVVLCNCRPRIVLDLSVCTLGSHHILRSCTDIQLLLFCGVCSQWGCSLPFSVRRGSLTLFAYEDADAPLLALEASAGVTFGNLEDL